MKMELKPIIGRDVLLEKLNENRKRYVDTRKALIVVYKKKSEEYKKAYAEYDKKLVESKPTGNEMRPYPPTLPEDRTDTYIMYVEMIDRHCNDTLEIDSGNFNKLFMDNWGFIKEHIDLMTDWSSGHPTLVSALSAYED